jgi:hypothetical protein
MNINDYVMNFAQTNGFPDKLVLSKDLAGDFYRLWEEGERRSIEIGYNMLYDRNNNVLAPDKLNKFEGTAIYTVFPDQSAANIYGDIHTHPANSIGHVDGYAAHSLSDVKGLSNNAAKPIFIRFVASGYYIYAMVYRNGLSQLDDALFIRLMEELEGKTKTLFLNKTGLTEDQRVDMLSTFKSEKQAAMWMLNAKKTTPGFGVEMQRLSIKYCKKVANTMNLGFYAGYRGWFGWYTNQAFTLERKV